MQTLELITKISDELQGKSTRKAINYANMGQLAEGFSIDQTIKTSNLLKKLEDYKPAELKKLYNYELEKMLYERESLWEVNADHQNAGSDPARKFIQHLDKGHFMKFKKSKLKSIGGQ